MMLCEIKRMLLALYEAGGEPELEIAVEGQNYMIIMYGDDCTFQRCGDNSKETSYSNLDELFRSAFVDGIKLADAEEKIEVISIEGCGVEEFNSILQNYRNSPICKKRIEKRKL